MTIACLRHHTVGALDLSFRKRLVRWHIHAKTAACALGAKKAASTPAPPASAKPPPAVGSSSSSAASSSGAPKGSTKAEKLKGASASEKAVWANFGVTFGS